MNTWIIPALICLFLWGFFPKISTNYLSPESALIYELSGALIFYLILFLLYGFKIDFHIKGSAFALLTGITGFAGAYFYLIAAQKGNISQIVVLTSLYPVFTVLLSLIFLKEDIGLRQGIGILMSVCALYLISK